MDALHAAAIAAAAIDQLDIGLLQCRHQVLHGEDLFDVFVGQDECHSGLHQVGAGARPRIY